MKLQVLIRNCVIVFSLLFGCLSFAEEAPASVNINTASAEQLAAGLKGVGLKTANRIVAYRDQNGGFSALGDLVKVKGVGVATVEKNLPNMTLE